MTLRCPDQGDRNGKFTVISTTKNIFTENILSNVYINLFGDLVFHCLIYKDFMYHDFLTKI